MRRRNISNISILFLILFALSTKSAHAYLDPGTGSFVMQMLAAGALGALFAIKTFWNNIKGFFMNIFSKKNSAQPTKKTDAK